MIFRFVKVKFYFQSDIFYPVFVIILQQKLFKILTNNMTRRKFNTSKHQSSFYI